MCKLNILKALGLAEPEQNPETTTTTTNRNAAEVSGQATAQPANGNAEDARQVASRSTNGVAAAEAEEEEGGAYDGQSETAMTEIDLGPPDEVTDGGSGVALRGSEVAVRGSEVTATVLDRPLA
ncbi:uncharacterized protein LOC142907256 [Petromyzon marinus]|uniref:uncharacterized protein LOC142907256 n=1 Tax=Petromyzon marinus TaxID=7757 RepID=UPI003F72AA4F